MQTVYIKFSSERDRVNGFYELARHASVNSLPGFIYQTPFSALALLEKECIEFRRASDEEIKAANDQVRNPAAAVIQ